MTMQSEPGEIGRRAFGLRLRWRSPLLSPIQYPRFLSPQVLPYLLMLSSKPSAAN